MINVQGSTRSCGSPSRLASSGAAAFAGWVALFTICLGVLPVGETTAQEPTTRPAATGGPSTAEAPATQPRPASGPATRPAEKGLLMNFKNASLQAVLEYLSEAAGLVILNGVDAEGRVTIMSRNRLDTDEAVALLDTILKEKGYTAIRIGRLLKIVTLAQAAKENLPVRSGSDPSEVPLSDRLVTQVIPIRYVDATRLRTDLTPLISTGATLTANQASNSLILIDTQTNIRRVMQVIRALDGHMAAVAEVKIYQLKYADATNTSRLITELFRQDQDQRQGQRVFMPFGRFGRRGRGDQGRGQDDQAGGRQQKVVAAADQRTNTLVVSAPPDLLKVIDGVVKELDSDPTEEQSVFIYPLKNAQAKSLETVLNQIFSETTTTGGRTTGRATAAQTRSRFSRFRTPAASTPAAAGAGDMAGQVYVVADEDTNSLLVRTATRYVERVKEILAELDRPIRQVLIKVLIAEVTHDDQLDLGTEFSILNLRLGASGSFTLDLGGTPDDRSGGLVTATAGSDLNATFNALQIDGRLDVLSRPYILASDNKEASITVGQRVPFLGQSRVTDAGQTISNIDYENIGIILKVTPHVNPEGLVIMSVSPEISSISDTTVTVAGNIEAQVYNTRSATTEVAVHNGQTIVIGGLMEDRITDSVRKVPLLGDIPLLGWLFRRTMKRTVKTELLIFLTPRVVEEPRELEKMSKEETAGSKALREAGGPGAFEEHMKAMGRGGTTQPTGKKHEPQP